MEPIEEEKLIRNCDALVWVSKKEEDDGVEFVKTIMSFFRAKNDNDDLIPTEMGFKYNIMLFQRAPDADMFTAIIGDPKGYAERLGMLGYHGMMFKKNAKHTPEYKAAVLKALQKWGFDYSDAIRILNTTVA